MGKVGWRCGVVCVTGRSLGVVSYLRRYKLQELLYSDNLPPIPFVSLLYHIHVSKYMHIMITWYTCCIKQSR